MSTATQTQVKLRRQMRDGADVVAFTLPARSPQNGDLCRFGGEILHEGDNHGWADLIVADSPALDYEHHFWIELDRLTDPTNYPNYLPQFNLLLGTDLCQIVTDCARGLAKDTTDTLEVDGEDVSAILQRVAQDSDKLIVKANGYC